VVRGAKDVEAERQANQTAISARLELGWRCDEGLGSLTSIRERWREREAPVGLAALAKLGVAWQGYHGPPVQPQPLSSVSCRAGTDR